MAKYIAAIVLLSILVLAAVIYGFYYTGSPGGARAEKFDNTRLGDIQQIKSAVENYYYKYKMLPESLEEAALESYAKKDFRDPETNSAYNYSVVDELNYKVCATFGTDTMGSGKMDSISYGLGEDLKHPKGDFCFDFKVEEAATNIDDYPYWVTSKIATEQSEKKSRVAQSFDVTKETKLKGVRIRFDYENTRAGTDGKAILILGELTDENDPDKLKKLTSAELLPRVYRQTIDQEVFFPTAVTLSENKNYVMIFEDISQNILNLSYSKSNPETSGDLYSFDSATIPGTDAGEFVWRKIPESDLYFVILK